MGHPTIYKWFFGAGRRTSEGVKEVLADLKGFAFICRLKNVNMGTKWSLRVFNTCNSICSFFYGCHKYRELWTSQDLIKDILSDNWNCLSIAALHIFRPIWTIFEPFAKQEPDVLHEVGRGFCCAGRHQPLPACWGAVPWGGWRDKPVRLLLLVTLVQGFSAFYPLNCCLPVEEPYLEVAGAIRL